MTRKPPKTIFSYNPPKTAEVPRLEKIFVAIALAFALPILLSIAAISLYRLSPQQEIKLFSHLFNVDPYFGETKAAARSLRQAEAINASEQYLKEVLAALQKRQKKFPYGKLSIHLLCDAQPNAYAIPGNRIFVTSGLLQVLESENGLAFVIGHELGHFAYRHHITSMKRYITVALMSLILSSSHLLDGVLEVSSIKFNHNQETMADRYGFKLVAAVYGHGLGSDELFRHMLKRERQNTTTEYALSHPPSNKRLSKLKRWQHEEKAAIDLAELPKDLFAAACTSFSAEDVRKAIRDKHLPLRQCYERALVIDPNLQGTIVVKIVIDGNGQVKSQAVTRTSITDGELIQCVLNTIAGMSFPKDAGRPPTTVEYPFRFAEQ